MNQPRTSVMLCPGEKPDQADGNNQKGDPNDHPLEGVHNGVNTARPMPMVIAHLEPGPHSRARSPRDFRRESGKR